MAIALNVSFQFHNHPLMLPTEEMTGAMKEIIRSKFNEDCTYFLAYLRNNNIFYAIDEDLATQQLNLAFITKKWSRTMMT
jgi:hypothetical protein